MSTINFGIDLGTTNSLIAKYQNGKVEVFKNPIGLKDTLPSVVAFRKERILVGDKAREYAEKDPDNVFSLFKRKMGTSDTYTIKSLGRTISPIELSGIVLKELKNFIYTGDTLESVVITIPASFDTIQSNATKKAGYEAGFKEVVLLQEPIAASLAFANKTDRHAEGIQGQWLVYDLGGGTFDVALLQVIDGEMKVIDHEGDNFLGGLDFDSLLIEQLLVPEIQKIGSFANLWAEMRSASGKYNKLYQLLLFKAEEAKIALSAQTTTEVEFEVTDDTGTEHECLITIARADFEQCIRPKIAYSIELVQNLLAKNNRRPTDITQVILIGGSTYIPLVKTLLSETLHIGINQSIDPTNAVAVGAAYYAGTKTAQNRPAPTDNSPAAAPQSGITVQMAYQKNTQDQEEYFTAAITGAGDDFQYRIARTDGGYDSGAKRLTARISEILPLLPDVLNIFHLKIVNAYNDIVHETAPIEILQGKFSVYGQPLPNDICIEIDDIEHNSTKLKLIFEKNAILPLKKTFIQTVSRTIAKDADDSMIINVLEGSRYASPASALPLGIVEIKGSDLMTNLVKGSDIEIILEISESRDLRVSAVLLMTDQEFSEVFSPSERHISINKLQTEVLELLRYARRELSTLERTEQYALAAKVKKAEDELSDIYTRISAMRTDDVSDEKYQIEERKRKLAQALDTILGEQRTESLKIEYFESKHACESWLEKDDQKRTQFNQIVSSERAYLASNNPTIIKNKIRELDALSWQIRQKDPTYLASLFHHYSWHTYPDNRQKEAERLIEKGEKSLERQNYDELLSVIYALWNLLPPDHRTEEPMRGTGLQ